MFSGLVSAQPDEGDSRPRDLYFRMQTGYQSPALGSAADFASSLDLDVALGYTLPHFVLEANLGASFSLGSTRISELVSVESYAWAKLEGLMYLRLGSGRTMFLLGGGIGLRHLEQTSRYTYQEGEVFQITSDTERASSERVISSLARLVVVFSARLSLSLDYDRYSLKGESSSINTLGVNVGYVY